MEIIKIKEHAAKLYKKMLDSLGYETEKIKKEQIDVPIYVLFEVRAALRSDDVKQYSKRNILRVRNVGKLQQQKLLENLDTN